MHKHELVQICLTGIILFLLFFIISYSYAIADISANPSFSPDVQDKMGQVMDSLMETYDIPGAIVGVFVPGEGRWIRAKGKACVETGEILRENQTFRIGSITKTFTATVILQLVDEGRLGLDDTLDKFFPSVPASGKITIRQLCNNTSGIFNYSQDEKFGETILNNNYLVHFKPEELVNIAISHEPYFPPDTGYMYSNTNFILLGMIIEKITGKSFEEEVRKRIITPLGLNNTTFPTDKCMTGYYSHGYMHDYAEGSNKLLEATTMDPSITWAAGAMISNLEDLFIWSEVLAEGTLLKKNTQKERLRWSSYSVHGPVKYGLGIYSIGDFIGHDGGTIGYNCSMFYLPQKKASIIVLLNNENDLLTAGYRMFPAIAKIVLPDYTKSRE